MSKESFSPLKMAHFSYDIWMSIWEAYGDPCLPPSLEDILHLVTPVMTPTPPDEITPPDALVATSDLVPATAVLDPVQQETSCLPTLTSWENFLP